MRNKEVDSRRLNFNLQRLNFDLPPKKDFNHPNQKSINDSFNFITDSKRAELRKKRKKRRK